MTNYTKTTDFAAKDSLPSGDSGKIIRGTEFETEFDNIATAVNSKSDANNPTFTGTVTIDGLTVNGNTVLGNAATDTVTVTANMLFGDNNKAIFGSDSDLEIYHGTLGTIINHVGTSGVLSLNSDGSGVNIYSNDATSFMARFVAGGASSLFFNAFQKLATTNTGIDVNGSITSDGIDTGIYAVEAGVVKITNAGNPRVELLHPTNSTDTYLESTSSGSIELRADVNNEATSTYILGEIDGNTTFKSYNGGDFALFEDTGSTEKLRWDASDENLEFADNSKAVFGAGSDLEIYHNGSNSFINDTGTGSLYVRASDSLRIQTATNEEMIKAEADGAVTLYNNNSAKLATTTAGIDVTGTTTTDGLTVQTAQGNIAIPTSTSTLNFDRAGTSYLRATDAAGNFSVITGADNFTTKRMDVLANGDIRFYENSGTTPKFVWDSSAERLGLGTTAPTAALTVFDNTGSLSATPSDTSVFRRNDGTYNPRLEIQHSTEGTTLNHSYSSLATDLIFSIIDSEKMRISNTGVDVTGSDVELRITDSRNGSFTAGDTVASLGFYSDDTSGGSGGNTGLARGVIDVVAENAFGSSHGMVFKTRGDVTTAAQEAMRISSAGNLLVGKTSADSLNTVGAEVQTDGQVKLASDGKYPLQLNRLSSPGEIINFRQDGSTVGTISAASTNVIYGNDTRGLKIEDTLIIPRDVDDTTADGLMDLGSATSRFKDLHLSGDVKLGGTGATVTTAISGDLITGQADTGLRFYDGGDAIIPRSTSDAQRNGTTDLGASNGRFKDLYLSGGVYLGGIAAANKLDDYEEGTWTPTASSYDGTLTVDSATYVKVGALVTAKAKVSFDATGDGSGVNLAGLPFVTTGVDKANGGFIVSSTVSSAARMQAVGTNSIYLTTTNDSNVTYTAMASTSLEFVFIYETTS